MTGKNNILITSLLMETKKFLTVGELVVCCSLNKENEKEISEISGYIRKVLTRNVCNLVEDKEEYIWYRLMRQNTILYQVKYDNEIYHDVEPLCFAEDDYVFVADHIDFMISRRKLYPIICIFQIYLLIFPDIGNDKVSQKLSPTSRNIEEIIVFAKNFHPDIFEAARNRIQDDEIFNNRLRDNNMSAEIKDFLLITIVINIALKINGFKYIPIQFSENI